MMLFVKKMFYLVDIKGDIQKKKAAFLERLLFG